MINIEEVFEKNGKFYAILMDCFEIRENYLDRVWCTIDYVTTNNLNLDKNIIRKKRLEMCKKIYGCEY